MSQVFFGQPPGIPLPDIRVEKFLPGAGQCNDIVGAYETIGGGLYQYTIWNLNGLLASPIFSSTVALDPHDGYKDGAFGRRIGDYTGIDCTTTAIWAAWTDTKFGQPAIWGIRIPLPLN